MHLHADESVVGKDAWLLIVSLNTLKHQTQTVVKMMLGYTQLLNT